MRTSLIEQSNLHGRGATWMHFLILGILLTHALGIPLRAYHKIEAAPKGVIENGIPPFSIFSSDSLGLQTPPFDLTELPDGRILIVGATELVVGDGVRWELIHRSPNESRYLSGQVSIDEKGQIWTSLYEGFCKVLFDEKGQWYFDKPVPLPDHENRQWPALLLTKKINRQDYWFGSALISWSPDERHPPRILQSNLSTQHIFQLGNRLYAANPNTGNLLRIEPDGGVSTVFTREHNEPESSIESSTPLDEKHMLVGTSSNGLCVFDGTELRNSSSTARSPVRLA